MVAIDRKFISREDGVERLHKIVDYLTRADRFHGVWPHWLDGPTGKVKPFGMKDDGGDLVESCFVMQSLLCVRQYFENGNPKEKELCEKINKLWHEMEFDWYQNGKDVIYWHCSPNYGLEMIFPLEGYNEALIVYVLAAVRYCRTLLHLCLFRLLRMILAGHEEEISRHRLLLMGYLWS